MRVSISYSFKWVHSFTRLYTILLAALWQKFNLLDLLSRYWALTHWPPKLKTDETGPHPAALCACTATDQLGMSFTVK
jgi:hypothetical protein